MFDWDLDQFSVRCMMAVPDPTILFFSRMDLDPVHDGDSGI